MKKKMRRGAPPATSAAGKEKSRRNPVVTSPMTSRSWTALWKEIGKRRANSAIWARRSSEEYLKAYLNMQLRRGEFTRWLLEVAASERRFASDASMLCLSFQQVAALRRKLQVAAR